MKYEPQVEEKPANSRKRKTQGKKAVSLQTNNTLGNAEENNPENGGPSIKQRRVQKQETVLQKKFLLKTDLSKCDELKNSITKIATYIAEAVTRKPAIGQR